MCAQTGPLTASTRNFLRVRKYIVTFLCIGCSYAIPAQDLIIKTDQSKIFCEITKIDSTVIYYKPSNSGHPHEINILKADVLKCYTYAGGLVFDNHNALSIAPSERYKDSVSPKKAILTKRFSNWPSGDSIYVMDKREATRIKLRETTFDGMHYGFSVINFIDGRLNKQKESAMEPSGWSLTLSMNSFWNDSLEKEVNTILKKKHSHFDTSVKMIVVLKHVYSHQWRDPRGRRGEGREVTLSLDYYKTNGSTCTLVCQQYYNYFNRTNLQVSSKKNIPAAFSKALELAFKEFDTQLRLNAHPPFPEVLDTAKLYAASWSMTDQVVTDANVKEGLYFSNKDLYLNKPALIRYIPTDTLNLVKMREVLNTNDYLSKRAFAIVRNKRVFIYTDDDCYKEFFFTPAEKLYFYSELNTISPGTRTGANTAGMAGSFLVGGGLLGGIIGAAISSSIKTKASVRVGYYIQLDYETGCPIPYKPVEWK